MPGSVTNIGVAAFELCTSLTNVTIGTKVTSIGDSAFEACYNLTNVTIPGSVISIGDGAFLACASLTSITIPASVTNLGVAVFQYCNNLTNVTILCNLGSLGSSTFYGCGSLASIIIPGCVTNIGASAFGLCASLTSVYFGGDAPGLGDTNVFSGDNNATVYYLPGTTGWNSTLGGRPTALWRPLVETSGGNFGVRTNQFGFNISWASGMTVVVEACSDLANPLWFPLATNTLIGSSSYFSDPQWTNYTRRFYRLSSTNTSFTSTGMVLIPAVSFTMGNCMDPNEGSSAELPLHTVNVSAFW
ncbi:MAG: leucine-rich repeat protein, partial [Verrucomicrobia bacterium]|nr:leucine-rich repeat protein [Verrucomicrobiota bacterium]